MDEIQPLIDHPLKKYVHSKYEEDLNYHHNSIETNPKYPKRKLPILGYYQFTVIGNYLTKEFIECTETVNLFYAYRKDKFKKPIIKGVTPIEWPSTWNALKLKYPFAFCLRSQVGVLVDDQFLGGEDELKAYLRQNFKYYVTFNYNDKLLDAFVDRVKSSGRPHVYMHIEMAEKYIGTLIFMLYNDIVPLTCENFIRLCNLKRGGYSGTPIHRVVKDGWIQCGGFAMKAPDIPCENYVVKHDRRGVLCMANDGRNRNNSTQFFVLLQPAEWMAHKYVAFGQLIEGSETLKKIEQVPTYYESPKVKITIMDSGTLQLVSHDTMPYIGAKEYVQSHIEDLIELGHFLINMILENVFNEIGDSEFGEEDSEFAVKDSKRFQKDDIKVQMSYGEFGEHQYYEELSYHQVSLNSNVENSVVLREDYYLPLTDVPYPGEKDSVFDFKRLLKGYYCMESDLVDEPTDIKTKVKESGENRISRDHESKNDSRDESLNSRDNEAITEYLRVNADKVSFGGHVIRRIAYSQDLGIPTVGINQLLTEESTRRPSRKISIVEPTPDSDVKSRKSWDREYEVQSKANIKFREDSVLQSKCANDNINSHVEKQPARFSVLSRLCERKTYAPVDTGPTFKEYGLIDLETNNFFLTRCRQSFSEDCIKDKCGLLKSPLDSPPAAPIMPRELERKISVNYVKIMDMSRRHQQSIRSVEYQRYRPSMSIEKYQELHKKK